MMLHAWCIIAYSFWGGYSYNLPLLFGVLQEQGYRAVIAIDMHDEVVMGLNLITYEFFVCLRGCVLQIYFTRDIGILNSNNPYCANF